MLKFVELAPYLQKHMGNFIGASAWKIIEQSEINKFAELTNDFNPLHIEEGGAFGPNIAHGFFILSLFSAMAAQIKPKIDDVIFINYGFNKIRFMQPVLVGSNIRAKFYLANYDARLSNTIFIYYDVIVEIEHIKKPAVKASWIIAVRSSSL